MTDVIATSYTAAQIATIRRTVAPETTDNEFDLFMNAAKAYGLDPFRRQISILIFNRNDPKKRRHAIIVGRDGLRSIAQRCRDYRPASEKADIEYDPSLISPENPKGIVSATVRLWKRDNRNEWYPVIGEAFWDEFAPVEREWVYDESLGRRAPTGKAKASGQWTKMPILMITKCAEAQALRAGWPDQFGGLYLNEEMDQARDPAPRNGLPIENDMTPSEQVAMDEQERRERATRGKQDILMVMDDTGALERILRDDVANRCAEFIRDHDAEEIHPWLIRNREALRDFQKTHKRDAIEIKRQIEAKEKDLPKAEDKAKDEDAANAEDTGKVEDDSSQPG